MSTRFEISDHAIAMNIGRRIRVQVAMLALTVVVAGCGERESGSPPAQKGGPAAMRSPGTASGDGPPAVAAKVLIVAPQRVPIRFESIAQIEGSKEVDVRARVSGILQKRIYGEGEIVQAGAALFQIDPATYEIALVQTKAALAQERARNEQARRESIRLRQLAEQRAISQREFDDAASALKLSDAGIQVAEARVREAELNLSYTLVKAPVAGVTGRAVKSEGSLITAGQDNLLTTISQISPIWVRFSLSESDLEKLPDQRGGRTTLADVQLVLADGTHYAGKGRINYAATQIDPRVGTRQMRAEFDNEARRLLPGQFVRVQVIGGYRDNAFLVPQTAVLQNEKGHFVFVLGNDSKVALRQIKTGEWVGSDWTILSGLSPGDRVVVDNLQKLQPGATVKPVASSTPDPSEGSMPDAGRESNSPPPSTRRAAKDGVRHPAAK